MPPQESESFRLVLLTLHTEIHDAISSHLEILDTQSLRLTCHHFHALILPLTLGDLLIAEKTCDEVLVSGYWLACAGCNRLRLFNKFSPEDDKEGQDTGQEGCVQAILY
jgi:hypothetical protein